MATKEEEKKFLDSVTTFVAELPGLPLAEALKKFQGKHTARTLAAARRMGAKKRQVKIPQNLRRQLWRITGGWHQWQPAPKVEGTPEKVIRVGDIELRLHKNGRHEYNYVFYRARCVAYVEYWRDGNRLSGAFASLGVPFTPSQQG